MITTLLLDLGNVFVFHDNVLLVENLARAAGRSVEEANRRLTPAFLDGINRGHIDADGMLTYLRDTMGIAAPHDVIEATWSSHFEVHQAFLPIIERLVGRVKLVAVSNTNALHVRYCKAALPILERLDALVLSNEVGLAKPDPAIYQHALAEAGAKPEEAAFFDDVQRYVDAASALGIHGRLFTTAEQFEADIEALGVRG